MASIENQFFLDASAQHEDWLDFDQFLDLTPSYSDDYSASATSISPDMSIPYEADMFANNLPDLTQTGFPDMINYDMSHDGFFDQSPNAGLMHDPAPIFDDASFNGYNLYDTTFDFRQMVEAQAAADSRVASIKEKRREAAIALHLQRLCDKTALDLDMSSDSNTSFSSPCWSDYMRESISPQPTSSASPEQVSAPPPYGNGGMEMVLDLNMNATTNVPKKQKPRSQAQKENYIKARKYGACEKHKKQHKRCNCLEKAAAAGVPNSFCDVPMDVAYRERVQLPSQKMSGVPSPRLSGVGVPGNYRPESLTNVQPTVTVTRKITTDSPVNSPSSNPGVVQPFTRAKTRTTSNSPGHDPQYSTSFVLSPTDVGKARNSAGQDPWPHTSRMQNSKASAKSAGLPTSCGCTQDLSGDRHTFSRHIATTHVATNVKQKISIAASNSRKPDCVDSDSSHVLEVIARRSRKVSSPVAQSSVGSNVVQQRSNSSLQARERIPSGLEVYRPLDVSSRAPRTSTADRNTASPSAVQNSSQQSVRHGPTAAGLAQAKSSSLCPNYQTSLQSQSVQPKPGLNVATRILSRVRATVDVSTAQFVSSFSQSVSSYFGSFFGRSEESSVEVPASRVSIEDTDFFTSKLLIALGLRKLHLVVNVGKTLRRLL